MALILQISRIAIVLAACAATTALSAAAQRPAENARDREARTARRSTGMRVGSWHVELPATDTTPERVSPHFEAYLQRGLDRHLGIENSLGVWRRVTQEVQALPLGGERIVETKSYIVPVMTSLKFYPITDPWDFFDPYITGGVGVALGIVHEAENAIGGGGTSIATGFALRTGIGLEIHVTSMLGLVANGRYQWTRFSKDLGSRDVFNGAGLDGGITYRFRF
jgi:opacity protein-like surface antigen